MSGKKLIKEAESLYKQLSDEEKGFFDANLIIPKMKVLLFEFINSYVETRNAILGKYKLIQEQIEWMREKHCPDCGHYLSFKDREEGYHSKKLGYLGHYECSNEGNHHRFLATEIPLKYLWNITDLVEEKIE